MLPAQHKKTTATKDARKKNRKAQQVMVPIHIKITEEMYELLGEVAKNHGFPRIQGLIRLYIRQGLDAENVGYSLAEDERFLQKLRRQGVSETILAAALQDTKAEREQDLSQTNSELISSSITKTDPIALTVTDTRAAINMDTPHPDLIIR